MKVNKKYLSFYYEGLEEIEDIKLDLNRTALLIIDLQNEFVSREIGDAKKLKDLNDFERWIPYYERLEEQVVPNTKRLLDTFRSHEMTVTYGRIACFRKDGMDRSPVQKSEGWNGMLVHKDSYGAQMVDELLPLDNEIVVNKTTDSVTTGTNYLQLLNFMNIETVIVTGIVTDQCVSSTVRGLADAGYKVIVVEDATTAATIELHEQELRILNIIYCNILNTEETINLIEKEAKVSRN